jgi:hypothetical protein
MAGANFLFFRAPGALKDLAQMQKEARKRKIGCDAGLWFLA